MNDFFTLILLQKYELWVDVYFIFLSFFFVCALSPVLVGFKNTHTNTHTKNKQFLYKIIKITHIGWNENTKNTHTQTNKHNFCFNTLLLSDNYWPVTFITHKKIWKNKTIYWKYIKTKHIYYTHKKLVCTCNCFNCCWSICRCRLQSGCPTSPNCTTAIRTIITDKSDASYKHQHILCRYYIGGWQKACCRKRYVTNGILFINLIFLLFYVFFFH